jgi:DNA helicase-2/ATP-dependent DNA helicase PcrA
MNSTLFDTELAKLNPEQRAAVEEIEGPVMVIAGPGTGKTQILTLRIANILRQTDISPQNILALTFTEAAAFEMKSRLARIIGTAAYRVKIATFHSFCNDIIQEHSVYFQDLMMAEAITELEQILLMEEIFSETELKELKPFNKAELYLRPALQSIGNLKKEGITPALFAEAIDKQEAAIRSAEDLYSTRGKTKGQIKKEYQKQLRQVARNRELTIVYQKYQEQLRLRKRYDFNDMLIEVIEEFHRNEELLLAVQEQYQYFLVDEHQDTNAAQNAIVELLASFHDNPNLFVVGDEKQAIFRFQGASLENFLYFTSLYPTAKLINLVNNYRSSQTILDAATSLIRNNPANATLESSRVRLLAQADRPVHEIKIAASENYHTEYYFVADTIRAAMDRGTPGEEIVILARNNKDLKPMMDALEKSGVQFSIESDTNLLQDLTVQKLIQILRAVSTLGTDEDLVRALHIDCLEVDPLDVYHLIQLSKEKKISLWDLIDKKMYTDSLLLSNSEAMVACLQRFKSWKKVSYNSSFDYLFTTILHESGILEQVMHLPNTIDVMDKLVTLFQDIQVQMQNQRFYTLENFLMYIDSLDMHNIALATTAKTSQENAVRLMTAHRSKGLEFDIVFVINAFDGHWGNSRKKSELIKIPWEHLTVTMTEQAEVEANEDERRLFYVALTRARKELWLTYAKHTLEGKEQAPSQFISEIDPAFKTDVSLEQYEQTFIKTRNRIFTPVAKENKGSQSFLENKDYFAKLFRKKGLSATALNHYLKCPWIYFFKDLIGIPEIKVKQQMYGTAVHYALHRYINESKKRDVSVEQMIEWYRYALSNEPLTQAIFDELDARGAEVLKGYFTTVMGEWEHERLSEQKIEGVRIGEGVTLKGKIDMIELLPEEDGSPSKQAIVYDFKTTRPKSRGEIEGTTQKSTGDYKRQLVFYQLLINEYYATQWQMQQGVIEFLEPNESGNYKNEAFTITDTEVSELKELITKTAEEITTLSFWNKKCDDKDCEYCRIRSFITDDLTDPE